MKKKQYNTPVAELLSLDCSLNLLENLSIQAPMENFGDGGELDGSIDDGGDFWNYPIN